MSESPIERWMRCEISSGKAAELIGVTKSQFNEITTPMLFAVEAAVRSLSADEAQRARNAVVAHLPIALDVLPT